MFNSSFNTGTFIFLSQCPFSVVVPFCNIFARRWEGGRVLLVAVFPGPHHTQHCSHDSSYGFHGSRIKLITEPQTGVPQTVYHYITLIYSCCCGKGRQTHYSACVEGRGQLPPSGTSQEQEPGFQVSWQSAFAY